MKFLAVSILVLAFGLNAATNDNYYSNDGTGAPPELFNQKATGEIKETGPFKTNGEFDSQKVETIEAQEEDPRDYSTTPEKRTRTTKSVKKEKKKVEEVIKKK